MKWTTQDYKGNKQVWYSEDMIEKIKKICLRRPYQTINKILQKIEDQQ